jgi:hypothetical protein
MREQLQTQIDEILDRVTPLVESGDITGLTVIMTSLTENLSPRSALEMALIAAMADLAFKDT